MKTKLKLLITGLFVFMGLNTSVFAIDILNSSQNSFFAQRPLAPKIYKTNYGKAGDTLAPFLYPVDPDGCDGWRCTRTGKTVFSETNEFFTSKGFSGSVQGFVDLSLAQGKYGWYGGDWMPVFSSGSSFSIYLDASSLEIDGVATLSMTYKPKAVQKVASKRGTRTYSTVAVQPYGMMFVDGLDGDFKASSMILNSYVLDGYIPFWFGDRWSDKFWLIDTYTNKVYIYNSEALKYKAMFRDGYFNLFFLLQNVMPNEVANISFNAGTDKIPLAGYFESAYSNSNESKFVKYLLSDQQAFNSVDFDALTLELRKSVIDVGGGQYFLKDFLKELGLDGSDVEEGGNGGTVTKPDETAFNQCVENWQNVKDLYYQYLKCEKGEKPTSGPIGENGEIISTACSGYEAHTKYLQSKYKENWEAFEKEFFLYVNGNRESIDPVKKCGGGYKDETGILEKLSDYFYSGTKNLAGLVFNDKNVGYFNDVISSLTFGYINFSETTDGLTNPISDNIVNLGRGMEEIKDENGNSVKVSEVYKDRETLYDLKRKMEDPNISEGERIAYSQAYNKMAEDLKGKYGNFASTGFVASTLGSGFKEGDFKDESSNVFKKYYNEILMSYSKGKNVLNFARCQGGFYPGFNIFVHIFTLIIGFYIFRLFR